MNQYEMMESDITEPQLQIRNWKNELIGRCDDLEDAWALALDRSRRTGETVKIVDGDWTAQTGKMPDGGWTRGKFIQPSEE